MAAGSCIPFGPPYQTSPRGESSLRYIFLIYSREDAAATVAELAAVAARHGALLAETSRLGILRAADPLEPTTTATTVRIEDGRPMIIDGPFAETREQLAGYYILECRDLDEALEWAARIPTACKGGSGCVEIRPVREIHSVNG